MKTVLISLIIGSFSLLLITSCESSDIVVGLVIYKTNGDYFNNVCIGMHKDGAIWRTPGYGSKDDLAVVIDPLDSTYLHRVRLENGYVLAAEDHMVGEDAFLSMTILEYIKYRDKYDVYSVPEDTIRKYIMDTDPYLEYYYDESNPRVFELNDTAQINEIIRKGELEKYFKREK